MPDHKDRPSPGAAMQNLRRPMPLGQKMVTFFTNYWRRIRYRSTCCGHPGEPGC